MSTSNDVLKQELQELTRPELMRKCKEAGIGVLPEHTKENLIDMFCEKAGRMTIITSAVKDSSIKPGYIRVIINPGDNTFTGVSATGDGKVTGQSETAIEFMHNSRFYAVARNKEVDIPEYALSCIKDSTSLKVYQDENTGMPVFKTGPAFSYAIVGRGPPADLKDPGARTYESRDLRHRQEVFRKTGRFPTEREMLLAAGKPDKDRY